MEKITINGIEYDLVPRVQEVKTLKEMFDSGLYIFLSENDRGRFEEINSFILLSYHPRDSIIAIHIKDKRILEEYLENNNTQIEYQSKDDKNWRDVEDFVRTYNEDNTYKLKAGEYPIFKRNEDGEVLKFMQKDFYYFVLSKYTTRYKERFFNGGYLNDSKFETIPHDKETGLYHLQPVFYTTDCKKRCIGFYNAINQKQPCVYSFYSFKNVLISNIEPITTEQLQVMPFIFEMYQKLLNESKN